MMLDAGFDVNQPSAYIADSNVARAAHLKRLLGTVGFTYREAALPEAIDSRADALFVAADQPISDRLLARFVRRAPGAPVVVLSDLPLWKLITLAVRERVWMDVPKKEPYQNLLTRYASTRDACPAIVVENDPVRCDELLFTWQHHKQCQAVPRLLHNVGEAFEMAIDGRGPIILSLRLPDDVHRRPDTSTLIYSLCPTVIAIMTEAYGYRRSMQNYFWTQPNARFGLLKPPFRPSDLMSLLQNLQVAWPVTSPL